ncbi:MAG: AzlC family ABC transporter permease [Rhodobacteraceae bacterium]|nr:AzlC family ABC transporter permease [Paracoccaceae bacterium]
MVNRRFLTGLKDGAPFILVAAPFGTLFGVAATETGLNLPETMAMTVLVIAGAAQFTALVLMQEQAPTLVVIITALAVNLRMAMYSAALAPWLGKNRPGMKLLLAYFTVDQSFALSSLRYEHEPAWTLADRTSYFCGASLAILPPWVLFSCVGAVAGNAIPAWASLDFALPICFLAIIGPSLRSLPHVIAAGVSVGGALWLAWMPWSLGLIVAAMLAMVTGAWAERWLEGQS